MTDPSNPSPRRRRGRPTTVAGSYSAPRQLGRVSDEDWAILQAAAQESGKTFTEWAVGVLMKAAKQAEKRKGKK